MPTILKRFTVFVQSRAKGQHLVYHSAPANDVSTTHCGMSTTGLEHEDKFYQLPPPKISCVRCIAAMKKVWPTKGILYRD